MKTIYKYKLELTDKQIILMPVGAQILCAQLQEYNPTLWAMVDTLSPLEERIIYTFGTGNPINIDHKDIYIGTVQTSNGRFVWHVFEGINACA